MSFRGESPRLELGLIPSAPKERLAYADGLRAVAALWVFLFHVSKFRGLDQVREELPTWLNYLLFDIGDLGVSIFFVLSGFVMALTVGRAAPVGDWTVRFLIRRVARLTPPYYASIVVSLLMMTVITVWHGGAPVWPDVKALVAHSLYLQDVFKIAPFNAVYWTLVLELEFYLGFAVLIWLTSSVAHRALWSGERLALFRTGVFVATGLVSAVCAIAPAANLGIAASGFALLWFNFSAGVLSYWAWKESGRLALAVSGYCALLVFLALSGGRAGSNHFLLCAAVVAISLMFAGRTHRMATWLSWGPSATIGDNLLQLLPVAWASAPYWLGVDISSFAALVGNRTRQPVRGFRGVRRGVGCSVPLC